MATRLFYEWENQNSSEDHISHSLQEGSFAISVLPALVQTMHPPLCHPNCIAITRTPGFPMYNPSGRGIWRWANGSLQLLTGMVITHKWGLVWQKPLTSSLDPVKWIQRSPLLSSSFDVASISLFKLKYSLNNSDNWWERAHSPLSSWSRREYDWQFHEVII